MKIRLLHALRYIPLGMLLALNAPAQAQLGHLIEQIAQKVVPSPGAATIAPAVAPDAASSAGPTTASASAGLPIEGRELGELMTPKALLKDSPALQKLLGKNPVFIYDPANRPDPMLVPWTRARVLLSELDAIAKMAIAGKNWDLAQNAMNRMQGLGTEDSAAKSLECMNALQAAMMAERENLGKISGIPMEAKLPEWVAQNTTGIIFDGREPMCLVGTYVLKKGDLVPRQPYEVKIAAIDRKFVQYQVMDKLFTVALQEGE